MMTLARWKWIAAAPLVLGAGTAGAVALAQGTQARPQAPKPNEITATLKIQLPTRGNPDPVAIPEAEEARIEAVPPLIVNADGQLDIDPAAGFFDSPTKGRKDAPPPVKPGQMLVVEVLKALPGRPITGERIVRPDGTISLGFYGDLPVAGLNRMEIKVKLLEHLRKYLNDEVLGLARLDKTGKYVAVKPVDSNRAFVDDSYAGNQFSERSRSDKQDGPAAVGQGQRILVETLQALPGRPITGERTVRPDGTIGLGFYGDVQVAGLTRDQIKVKVIEHLRKFLTDRQLGLEIGGGDETDPLRKAIKKVAPADSDRVFVDDFIPAPQPRSADTVRELRGQVESLNGKLDRVLKELEELRRERGKPEPAKGGRTPF